MVKYDLTPKQREECCDNGSVTITRNGKSIRVTPSMMRPEKYSTFVRVYHADGPAPDSRDEALAKEYLAKWDQTKKPRVGDYIVMPNGKYERFSEIWPMGIQTTRGGFFALQCSGNVSFSGALNPIVPMAKIVKTSQKKAGHFWIPHHGYLCAGCAVGVEALCRVYLHR